MGSIDVCRLNGRPYVQATQMLARLCEQQATPGSGLAHAKFVRLTSRLLQVEPVDDETLGNAVGMVWLRRGTRMSVFRLLELADPAPERQGPPAVHLTELQHDQGLSGHCTFVAPATLEGALDGLVQGIKALHQGLATPAHNIWFTGLRGFDLPLDVAGFVGHGKLDVTKLRVVADGPRRQSLMNVTLSLEGLPAPCRGLVTFAYDLGDRGVD